MDDDPNRRGVEAATAIAGWQSDDLATKMQILRRKFAWHTSTLAATLVYTVGTTSADDAKFANTCRAAIGSVMGQSPSIINVDGVREDIVYVSYRRSSDGPKWSYRCKFEGNRVWWATSNGRWRNGPSDEKITFSIDPSTNSVTIMQLYTDGSKGTDVFPESEF